MILLTICQMIAALVLCETSLLEERVRTTKGAAFTLMWMVGLKTTENLE
jgi:hypothetical protein